MMSISIEMRIYILLFFGDVNDIAESGAGNASISPCVQASREGKCSHSISTYEYLTRRLLLLIY